MAMKSNLKLMPTIRSDHADSERKFLNYIINEFDGAILVVFWVNLQSPNTRCIINRCVLISPYRLSSSIF